MLYFYQISWNPKLGTLKRARWDFILLKWGGQLPCSTELVPQMQMFEVVLCRFLVSVSLVWDLVNITVVHIQRCSSWIHEWLLEEWKRWSYFVFVVGVLVWQWCMIPAPVRQFGPSRLLSVVLSCFRQWVGGSCRDCNKKLDTWRTLTNYAMTFETARIIQSNLLGFEQKHYRLYNSAKSRSYLPTQM